MQTIIDQPPPIATGRRPVWDIVIEYVHDRYLVSEDGLIARAIADMRDRDHVGRERYGTPLTSGNGRDHLIDAYQEMLDSAVYLVNELDEHGVGPRTIIDKEDVPNDTKRWRLLCVQEMFAEQVRALLKLRKLIEERGS